MTSSPAPQPSEHGGGTQRPWDIILPLILFAVSVIVFWPSVTYEFLNWDDETYIHWNPWLLNLSMENVAGVFRHPYFSNYHPLTMLSYMVDFQFFGYDPQGYRVVNIILHALTVAAGYGLFRSLAARPVMAFLFLLFFAVHPLRIESVVWISERKDVLCGLFYTLSAWAWVAAPDRGRRANVLIALAIVAAILALFAKAMAITIPLVFLAHDLILRGRVSRARGAAIATLAVLAIGFALLNTAAQEEAMQTAATLGDRIAVALYSPLHYLRATLVPVNLVALYPYESRPTQNIAVVVASAIACIIGILAIVYTWRRSPKLCFGLLSCAIVLGPVSGIVAFGAAWAADRYSYMPTMFLFAGFAAAASQWKPRHPMAGKIAVFAGILLSIMMAGITWNVMPSWRNRQALWERVLAVYPDSGKAQLNLVHGQMDDAPVSQVGDEAGALAERFRAMYPARALEAVSRLRENRPEEALEAARAIDEERHSLALQLYVVQRIDNPEEAIRVARRIAQLEPPPEPETLADAALQLARHGLHDEARPIIESLRQPTMKSPFVWTLLAEHARAAGDPDQAEHLARRALAIFPGEAESVRILGTLLEERNQPREAARVYRRAARHPATRTSVRGWALIRLAHLAQSGAGVGGDPVRLIERALSLEPQTATLGEDPAATYNYLGFLAEETNRYDDAERLYRQALSADPENLDAHLNLAFVLMQTGRFSDAESILLTAREKHPEDESVAANIAEIRRIRAQLEED